MMVARYVSTPPTNRWCVVAMAIFTRGVSLRFGVRQLRAAVKTILGLGWTIGLARRTENMRVLVTIMNHEIPHVGNPVEGIGKNNHPIFFVKKAVGKKDQRACQAQPPERRWYEHLLMLFGGIPLDHEPGKEDHISYPTDDLPHRPFDAQKFSIVPKHIRQPIHQGSMTNFEACM